MSQEIPAKCPKCGAARVDSEYAQAFVCGTLASASGSFYHTSACSSFAKFRKPLDEQRDLLAKRVEALKAILTGILANDGGSGDFSALRLGEFRERAVEALKAKGVK